MPDEPIRVVDRRWWARTEEHPDAATDDRIDRKPTVVEDLEQQVAAKSAQLQSVLADHRRALDEFEQIKLRMRRETAREVERARRGILAELLEVLDRSEYPILLHCRRGADRTGVASAVLLLLQTASTVQEARHQLGIRFGHIALGRPAYLDGFLRLYEEFLEQQGWAHSPTHFRHWMECG